MGIGLDGYVIDMSVQGVRFPSSEKDLWCTSGAFPRYHWLAPEGENQRGSDHTAGLLSSRKRYRGLRGGEVVPEVNLFVELLQSLQECQVLGSFSSGLSGLMSMSISIGSQERFSVALI